MSSYFAPPPAFNYSSQQFFYERDGNSAFSPAVFAIIGLLAAAFLIVSYHTAISKFWTGSRRGGPRRPDVSDESDDQNEPALGMLTRGLEESVIRAIPVHKYSKDHTRLVDGSECSVCLGEFQNDEALRLLPKCNHAFHVSCIDKWLQSHSNCPLCRANIDSSTLPRALDSPVNSATVTADDHENATRSRTVMLESGDFACSLDQRISSETIAYNTDDRRFTSVSDGEDAPRVEDPGALNDRCAEERTSLVGLKFNSTGLGFKQEGKLQTASACRGGDARPIFRRSCSMDFIYNRPVVGSYSTDSIYNTAVVGSEQTRVYDLFPGNRDSQLLWDVRSQGENVVPSRMKVAPSRTNSAGAESVVDMGSTGPSSSSGSPTDLASSRKFNYEMNLRGKANSMNDDPQPERRLFSFKAGHLIVKRSLSGGRLLGFMSKHSAGPMVNTRLPI